MSLSRGSLASAPRRLPRPRPFSTSSTRNADFTHAVVGGGVVGLAIARKLQGREGASTVLIEQHGSVGTETSSRNSEVIHAGIYYGTDSLKARLCLRGKELLYQLCQKHSIPHRNTGKWIVAQDAAQMEALDKIHRLASRIGVPTHFLTKAEAQRREPEVRAEAGVLESPSTGIVDSHSLMQYLQGDFENQGGLCAFRSPVTSIAPIEGGKGGWAVTTTSADGEPSTITAETLINSAGLAAVSLSNMILPPDRQRNALYAKGTYFSYTRSHPRPSTLIYPAPIPGLPGLGTHLTLDLAGRIRFGPDVQWTDNPADYTPNSHPHALAAALAAIRAYLPAVHGPAIHPDYAGIRPKLSRQAATTITATTTVPSASASASASPDFHDFYIERERGFAGFVNLLAIESPGLTASLAIAEAVEGLLYGA